MNSILRKASAPGPVDSIISIGLLILRVIPAAMMLFAHGIPKLTKFSELSSKFLDFLGIGSTASLVLAIFAEVVCSLLLIAGAFTRAAAIPLLITMLVAAFVVHGDDPFQKKEFALLYAIPFLALIFTGAGRFSVDGLLGKK